MKQSRLESFVEAVINIASGFVIALLTWIFIVSPVWEIEVTMLDNLLIIGMFTVISIIRSYFWRRFFNAEIHKQVHLFIGKLFNA